MATLIWVLSELQAMSPAEHAALLAAAIWALGIKPILIFRR